MRCAARRSATPNGAANASWREVEVTMTMPVASGPNVANVANVAKGSDGARGANAASGAPAAADVPCYGEAHGRASARELGAFEAALRRQSQAPRCGGTGDVDIDATGRAGRKAPAHREGVAAERSASGRGPIGPDAAAPGAAERRASGREATETSSAGGEREMALLPHELASVQLRRYPFDDEAPAPATLLPDTPAPPSALMTPPPLAAAVKAPAPAPRTLAAEAPLATEARRSTLAELATAPSALPQRWQVHITEPALPVRILDIERAAAGPLTLVVSTNQPVPAHHADKLRRLLAARGAEAVLGAPADRQDEEFPR
jgi:hypothetical protein